MSCDLGVNQLPADGSGDQAGMIKPMAHQDKEFLRQGVLEPGHATIRGVIPRRVTGGNT